MREYLALLRSRPAYRALWFAELVSQTGDWFSLVAVSIVSARSAVGGGALALATVLCAHLLPQALLSPAAGLLADRFDRRKVLVAGNLVEGLLTILMVVAAMRGSIAALQLLLLVRASVSALREPAAGASLPRLVDPSELAAANALGAATWSTTFVVGMALGGLATELGPAVALGVDAVSFFIAASLLTSLPRLVPLGERAGSAARGFGAMVASIARDLALAVRRAREPRVRAAVFGKTPIAIAAGAAWLALNLQAARAPFVGGAAATLGALQAARGVGTGVGPLVARALVQRGVGSRGVAHGAALLVAAGLGGLASSSGAVVALVAAFAWGSGGGALWVITMTEIQQRSADEVRGRLIALDTLGFAVGMSLTGLAAALAIEAHVALVHVAIAVVVLGSIGWIWIREAGVSAVDRADDRKSHEASCA